MTLTKEHVKHMVATNRNWAERAILALYGYQTDEEKHAGKVKETNRRGFNKYDTPFLTSLAGQLLNGHQLSQKQLAAARRALGKYSGQLVKIAEAKV